MERMAKLFVLVLAVALLGSACSSAATGTREKGSTQGQVRAGTIAVRLKEFAVLPSQRSVKSGQVTFSVTNAGTEDHEFVIIRTPDQPGALPVDGTQASEAGHVDEIEGIHPGTDGSLSVDLPPGHYVLLCNLPGHYGAGMYAGLTVG